jgi:CheY-like chemotaxis protein
MKKVLVVDDQIAKPIARLLRSFGLQVTAVTSYDDGVSAIQSGSFDFVLIDFSLPRGKSGLDLIALARSRRPCVRAILMSGRDGPPSAATPNSYDAFLSKPFSREEVAELFNLAPACNSGTDAC